jgi:hypothetical protein
VDAAVAGEVVSKGRFAELRKVSPGRVSQWISEGKIKPDALVGEGRNARIDVARATLQLRESLDIGQRTGNGLDTRLDLQPPAAAPVDATNETRAAPASAPAAGDPIADQIKQERLDQIRRANRRQAEEEAARSGKYIDTADAVRQMGAIASQLMSVVEGSLTELATAISAKFEIPQRDVLHLMRGEFRKVRASGAKMFRDKAQEMPPVLEAELDDPATEA